MHRTARTTVLAAVVGLVATVLTAFAPQAGAAFSDRDCGDFATQAAAQAFFLANGGPGSDPHRLDGEGDGVACESNPCPCSTSTSGAGASTTPATLTGGTGNGGSTSSQPAVIRQWARVVKVADGDTITVRIEGGPRRRVRIIGIDTPEVYGGVECGGREASRSMKRMLPIGTRVLMVSDPTQASVDRYGRLLRYVHKQGRLDVGRRQLWKGRAKVYVYHHKPFQRTRLYNRVQSEAKASARGLWSHC